MKSLRVLWRDVGLDYADHVLPGAFGFLVEGKTTAGWETLLDLQSTNSDEIAAIIPV